jgi:hypothetical protein
VDVGVAVAGDVIVECLNYATRGRPVGLFRLAFSTAFCAGQVNIYWREELDMVPACEAVSVVDLLFHFGMLRFCDGT